MSNSEKEKEEKTLTIIINGRPREVEIKKLTYQDLVVLAFGEFTEDPNIIYTITYSKGQNPDKGTMVLGEEVTLKKEMIFNVTRTDKS